MAVHAIIVAGGKGHRMKTEKNKCFIELLGKEIIVYSLKLFEESAIVSNIVLVVGEEEIVEAEKICRKNSISKAKKVVAGGKERQDSVWNGLKSLKELGVKEEDLIIVHDGARPFASHEMIGQVVEETRVTGASVIGIPLKDTIKRIDEKSNVLETPDRKYYWVVQTPQCIRYNIMINAFEKAFQTGFYGTDDVQLVERIQGSVKMILGSYDNIKITTPEDLKIAESILEHRIAFHEKNDGVVL